MDGTDRSQGGQTQSGTDRTSRHLNVLFITQNDPFYVLSLFDELLVNYDCGAIHIVGVVIQSTLGRKKGALVRQMLAFYGPRDFIRVSFQYVLKTAMSFLAVTVFRGRFPGIWSIEHLFLRHHVPIVHAPNINDPSFVEWIRRKHIDLVVSVAASTKFREGLLRAPRFGCINIHNAKLPRNRGMLPNFWALYNYDEEPVSGMTVHKMNASLDDGPIILQDDIVLDPTESLHQLILRTKRLNAHLLLKTMAMYGDGEPEYLPNDAAMATYNSFPTRADVRAFRAKGLRLL